MLKISNSGAVKGILGLHAKDLGPKKRNTYKIILITALILISLCASYFATVNEAYYRKTIAKVISVQEAVKATAGDMDGDMETVREQQIKAVIMNGAHKGETIEFQNETSYSQAYDMELKVNDEVFISMDESQDGKAVFSYIIDFKRDKYIAYISTIFVSLILVIGGMKGLRSLASVAINIVIACFIIKLYSLGFNLLLVTIIASLLFIALSISIVSGINRKAFSAIIGTMAATIITMLITAAVILLTHSSGIRFDEMEFVTIPPEQIFTCEILIGTLGAIMDIAITICSSMHELYGRNPDIEYKALIGSGMEIGKDIMSTMANTLVFAYISGSVPMILLCLKNGYSLSHIINVNIDLEIIRALVGSIGVVLSIPITLYICVMLLKKYKIGEA